MFGAMLDFFCSRSFPEKSPLKSSLISVARALFWGVLAMIVGLFMVEDAAFIGEHTQWTSLFTGTAIKTQEAFPILWTLVKVFLGSEPSILALNVLGALIFGALVSCTWGVVRFWALDAASEESVPGSHRWISPVAADVVCALLILSFPGLLAASSFNANTWGFLLVLVCVLLQNRYALNGGHRLDMILFASVLGVCTIESAWVLLFLPLFFFRMLAMEWRLWDHNVRNLPVWFIAFVSAAVVMIALNAFRVIPAAPFASIWVVQKEVARTFLGMYKSLFVPGALIIFAASVVIPFVAWVAARRLLNNDRSLGLLIVSIVLSVISLVLFYGFLTDITIIPQALLNKIPIRFWLAFGGEALYPMLPVATMWMNAVVLGMLLVGWGVQLFFKNPNNFEERDLGKIPRGVLAMRTGAFIFVPIFSLLLLLCIISNIRVFAAMNRYEDEYKAAIKYDEAKDGPVFSSMADQFGEYIVRQMLPNSGSLASGRTYVLGSPYKQWLISPVASAAKRNKIFAHHFNTSRESDPYYVGKVKEAINHDQRLKKAEVDLHLLNDMLAYNFNRFLVTFVLSEKAEEYVAVYDVCDYWYKARLRPIPAGALFIGVEEEGCEKYAEPLWVEHQKLRTHWTFVKDYVKTKSSWTDVNADTAKRIAEHLAFVANNLGTYYDDMACRIGDGQNVPPELKEKAKVYLQRAIDCYRYANMMNPENASAILNYYAICNTRPAVEGLLSPEDATLSEKKFKDFIKETTEKKRLYKLRETIRYYGYIRDARLFVTAGLSWALQAAPDAALATYRNVEMNLSEMGDERGAARVGAVMGAIYEEQGLLELAEQKYLAAAQINPDDVNVLRQLMNLALQRGNLEEASEYLRRVEGLVKQGNENESQLNATLLLDQAAYYIGIGDNTKARNLLARYTKDYPDDVVGWSMLAMLSIDEGRLGEVRGYISANIRQAKNTSPYYKHILDGRLAQAEAEELVRKSPGVLPHENQPIRKKYLAARAHYREAYAARPELASVVQLILQIDFILHDGVEAVRDAETLRQCDPDNPMASYAIGMKRMEDGILFGKNGAEGYFQRAIEASEKRKMLKPLELLVNAADVFARTDNPKLLEDALSLMDEGLVRFDASPIEKSYILATRALVLAHQGKIGDAQNHLTEARSLMRMNKIPEAPQLKFVNVWIAIKQGDKNMARKILNEIRHELGTRASTLDKKDFELIEQKLR